MEEQVLPTMSGRHGTPQALGVVAQHIRVLHREGLGEEVQANPVLHAQTYFVTGRTWEVLV